MKKVMTILVLSLMLVMAVGAVSAKPAVCGDGSCNGGEKCNTCVADCGVCPVCGDGAVNQANEQCDNGLSNGQICSPLYGESCTYCSSDCKTKTVEGPSCGDKTCNGPETCSSCSKDCGECAPTCTGNPGSIWTTNGDCGTEQQDVNHYNIGDVIYINGKDFCPGTYDWTIAGNPFHEEDQVASGLHATDANGAFCFPAYTVGPNDSGEYKVDFGKKNDNYQVDDKTPTVPEFGATVGILTALGALGVFFLVRRK